MTLFIICNLQFAICNLFGAFENISSGARPYGMGNAFVGLADDIQALNYNPGGLTQVRHGEFITYYARPFLGLSDKSEISNAFVGYLCPLRGRESVAVSVSDFRLSSIYNENITAMSFAKDVSKSVALGINMKLLEIKYGNDSYTKADPVFNKKMQPSFSGDAGLLAKLTKKFSIGLSAFNLNGPDIGIGEPVYLPVRLRIGFGWRPQSATVCFDIERQQNELKYFLGAEQSLFLDKFFVREGAGYGKDFTNISLGFSFLPDPLKIDYAFQLPLAGVQGILGSHHLSVAFEFGKEINDPYTSDLESEISQLKKDKEGLQNNLSSTAGQLSGVSADAEKTKTELEEIKKQKEQLEEENRRLEYRPPPKKITYHTVEKGDTLPSISQRYYGTSDRWQDIYNANKNKIERGMPVVGTQLVIP